MTKATGHAHRLGFTLIELIAVLLILFLLLALMLLSVSRGRAAARRTQCKNNLKQIGLALHNYADTFGSFPSGFEVTSNGSYQGWGWSFHLLPYLDAGTNLTHFVNKNSGLRNQLRDARFHSRIGCFRCPTDVGLMDVTDVTVQAEMTNGVAIATDDTTTFTFPRSNYFGVAGYLQSTGGGIAGDATGTSTNPDLLTNAGSLGNRGWNVNEDNRYCDPLKIGGAILSESLSQNRQHQGWNVKHFRRGRALLTIEISFGSCWAWHVGRGPGLRDGGRARDDARRYQYLVERRVPETN